MITQDYVKNFYKYDPDNGNFIWAIHRHGSRGIGSIAGKKDSHGYIQIKLNGKNYLAHRIAFLYMTGSLPIDMVDHIDGVRDNNSWANLRECSRSENMQNRKKSESSISGIKCVFWHKRDKIYGVKLNINGKVKCFGNYDDIELAELVAIEARNKYHGKFARHD